MRARSGAGRKLLVAFLALTAAAYAGTRYWIGYQAHEQLQTLGSLLEPYVGLSWEDVRGDLTGEVIVSGLIVTPKGDFDDVYIDRLILRADGLKDLAALARTLRVGQLPEYLQVTVRGAILRVGGRLHRAIERHGELWGTPLDAAACQVDGNLGAVVMSALGHNTVEINGDLRWRLHPPTRRVSIMADISVADVGATTVDAQFDLARLSFEPQTWLSDLAPKLTGLRLRMADNGFIASRNHVCAARRDLSLDDFLAAHIEAVRSRYGRAGTPPGDILLQRYAEFARHGGDLLLDLAPLRPLPPGELLTALRQRDLTGISASLTINGRPIQAQPSRWYPPPAPEAASLQPASTTPRGPRRVPAEALVEHVGSRAQIITSDGRAHFGVIESAGAERLTLRKALEGGYLDYRIPYATIETAEVHF